MLRKSSVHFQPVKNIRFAVSHSERTDLSEPAYLLPKEHQLGNVVVAGSLLENELAALFIQQKAVMTGQAKARGSSPFWEGVVVLADTNLVAHCENLKAWKMAYEKSTGHKVLHMAVHLDEGYMDPDGKPVYNPHAHVIVSRMDSKNRVIKLERKELAVVQDLTAAALKMERGSTLAERQGKRGRAHVGHKEFRQMSSEARLELDKKVPLLKAQVKDQAAEIARIKAEYDADRAAMKASGVAKQADYQLLKKAHEAALQKLKNQEQVIGNLLVNENMLHTKLATLAQENEELKSELEAAKAKFAIQSQERKSEGKEIEQFVPGQQEFTEEQWRRVDAIPALRASAGTAATFYQVATKALDKADGHGDRVDWQQVEESAATIAIHRNNQPEQAVLHALVTHSPGQVEPSMMDRLRQFINHIAQAIRGDPVRPRGPDGG